MEHPESHPWASRGRGSATPRILVIARHAAVADVLAMILRGRYDVSVLIVRPPSSSGSVTEAAVAARADAAVVTLDLGSSFDCDFLVRHLTGSQVPVVALATADPDSTEAALGRALLSGAVGVVSRTGGVDALLRAVACAVDRVSSPSAETGRLLAAALRSANHDHAARTRLYALTLSEREILAELTQGRCTTEIARARVVSEATVRTQVRSILNKLEVRSQLAAVALAVRAGGEFGSAPTCRPSSARRRSDVSGCRSSASS